MFVQGLFIVFMAGSSHGLSYCSYENVSIVRVIPDYQWQINLLWDLIKTSSIHIYPIINATEPNAPALFTVNKYGNEDFFKGFCANHSLKVDFVLRNVQKNLIQVDHFNSSACRRNLSNWALFDHRQYYNAAEINEFMETIASDNKDLCKIINIGQTREGRSIRLLQIKSRDNKGGKNGIFIEAAIHAREWISANIAVFIAQYLVRNKESAEIRKLLQNTVWYILPIFNLDGYEFSWRNDRKWRKNRRPYCEDGGYMCNCYGVDLNRNWDIAWNNADACPHPCCNVFPGQQPMSEPEARHLSKFLLKNQNFIAAYIALHNYGQHFAYPYLHNISAVFSNWANLQELAEMATSSIREVNNVTYDAGPGAKVMGMLSGTSTDWVADNTNISTIFTIETRPYFVGGDFCLEEAEILPICREVFAGIRVIANYVSGDVKLKGKYVKSAGK